ELVQTVIMKCRCHDLQAGWQASIRRRSGRSRHAAQTSKAQWQGAQVEVVHLHWILSLFTELKRCGWRGWGNQHINMLKGASEIFCDQGTDALCLQVVGVVVADRQSVGSQHDATLDLRTKAFSTGDAHDVISRVRAVITRAQAVAHAVETREVRRHFTRHNQVVRSKGIIKVRAVDLNGLSAL